MRALIVGQAPSSTDPGPGISRRAARMVGTLAGVGEEEVLALPRVNLLPGFPGKAGKGDAFPLASARSSARRLVEEHRGGGVLLLLQGLNVARAFDARPDLFRLQSLRGTPALVLPHPSGVNLWWNDPDNAARAGRVWRAVLRDVQVGLTERYVHHRL